MQGNDCLKICDDEFIEYKTRLTELAALLEEKISMYAYILQTVCNDGIVSGNAHDNLQAFVQALGSIEGQLMLLTEQMGLNVSEFHDNVDRLDENLYY